MGIRHRSEKGGFISARTTNQRKTKKKGERNTTKGGHNLWQGAAETWHQAMERVGVSQKGIGGLFPPQLGEFPQRAALEFSQASGSPFQNAPGRGQHSILNKNGGGGKRRSGIEVNPRRARGRTNRHKKPKKDLAELEHPEKRENQRQAKETACLEPTRAKRLTTF